MEHALLNRSPFENDIYRGRRPTARFAYLRSHGVVDISQMGDPDNLDTLNPLAQGQLALGGVLYRQLRPKFAFVDECGENAAGIKRVKQTQLKYIFWANFYGPAYVEKFGRDLFLNAPGWKKEELDDGGILYVVTENYLDWWQSPPKEVPTYFREHVPDVKLYRAKTRYE